MTRERAATPTVANFLLLRPEKATVVDLFKILGSSRISRRRSVETSYEAITEHRCMIVLSLLVQKLLLLVRKPMALIGYVLEMMLNTLSCNGGFWKLLASLLWGKVVIPDPMSKTYVSLVGNLDTRVLLDDGIRPGNIRYNGALAFMAAKLAYENKAFTEKVVSESWKMDFVGAYDFWNERLNAYATNAFVMLDKSTNPETFVVSFRGTQPFSACEWCIDFDISWYDIPGVGKAHAGFIEALGMQKTGWPKETEQDTTQLHVAYYFLKRKLTHLLEQNSNAKFMVTGHSLGGALAIMFPSILAINEEEWLLERLSGVYTYGQPRIGDVQFGDFVLKQFSKYGINYTRYVYCNDMVPRLPADDSGLLYKHFGTCLYFDSLYRGKNCHEEPNKNYFSPWAVIPMFCNAVWEMVRSYIIPVVAGASYRENRLEKSFRMFGLVVPGLSDHGPQDYDNVTRLGTCLKV